MVSSELSPGAGGGLRDLRSGRRASYGFTVTPASRRCCRRVVTEKGWESVHNIVFYTLEWIRRAEVMTTDRRIPSS